MRHPHSAIKYLIKSGQLKRPEICFNCNKKSFIVAHHPDYAHPYKTIWLCQKCHNLQHKQIKSENMQIYYHYFPNRKKPLPVKKTKSIEIWQISQLLPDGD
jgi:hypothetical protein